MPEKPDEKPSVTLPATVEKVIKPLVPSEPEKAQITVHDAEDLYKEIRVENTLTDEEGNPVKLKPGAKVEVTIEADPKDTTPARPEPSHQKK
jgi:protocatechuate 3,4-dioxygenase beta subunit